MAKRKKPRGPDVVCQTCGTTYEGYDWGSDQAYGCAATLTAQNKVYGHYGSYLVDMEVWCFPSPLFRPYWAKDGTICDKCLKTFMDLQVLVKEGRQPW